MSDSVGSVSVEVVPDARGWSEKLRAQLRDHKVTINADADTTEAETQLDEVARTRTATIKSDVSQLSKSNDVLGGFVEKLGLLPALAIAGSAALIPLAAAVGGVVAALAAPLAIAGGGATLFALLGGFAVKDTEKQLKNVDTLHKKLSGLTKGTQSYNDTLKQLNQAQAALTPAQVKFAGALDKLKLSFHGLLEGQNGQALLGPITAGITALAKILPSAEPLIRSVSGAFSTLLTELSNATSGPGFDKFVRMFSRQAGSDIVGFGHILGNITTGLGGLFGVLDRQVGHSLVDELSHLTGEFSDWANSKAGREDVKRFLDYFHQVGPQVAHTISSVASAIGKIVQALAPLGPVVLSGLTHAANAIASIPTPVLTALAGATVGLTAFGKFGGFKATGFALNKLTSGKGILGVGASALGGKGVVPVYVTNEGFGGAGGPGGGTSTLGKIGNLVLPAALLYGAYKVGQAKGNAETRAMGGLGLVDYERQQLRQQLIASGLPGGVKPLNVGPFHLSVPQGYSTRSLTATSTALDAIKAHAASASQTVDRIGPNAQASLAGAIRTVGVFQAHLDGLHDKRVQVFADTQAAIRSLEALQAYRIRNKSFTVYQRSQQLDRTVGPGGGQGQNPHGSGGGGASGVGATIHTHVHLDGKQIAHVVEPIADNVYHANRDYEDAQAGR